MVKFSVMFLVSMPISTFSVRVPLSFTVTHVSSLRRFVVFSYGVYMCYMAL